MTGLLIAIGNYIGNNNVNVNFWDAYYAEYADRATADGGIQDSRLATICAKNRFIEIMPFATEGYIYTWNTQFRSAADGGNGFDPASLDCAYPKVDQILNT